MARRIAAKWDVEEVTCTDNPYANLQPTDDKDPCDFSHQLQRLAAMRMYDRFPREVRAAIGRSTSGCSYKDMQFIERALRFDTTEKVVQLIDRATREAHEKLDKDYATMIINLRF